MTAYILTPEQHAQIVKNGKGVVIGGEWISVKAPAFATCSEAVAHFNKGAL